MPIAHSANAWALDNLNICSVAFRNPSSSDFSDGAATECFGYVEKGTGTFCVDSRTYTVNPGDIIYIHKGTPYRSFWQGEPDIHFYSIQFAFRDVYLPYPLQAVHGCQDLAPEIRALYTAHAARHLGAMTLFYTLFERLTARLETVSSIGGRTGHIEKALCYIRRNPDKQIRVSELAEMCALSEPHFYTVFKQHMGMTPVQYINKAKCTEVRRLLMNTDMSIEEISNRLGFSSPAFMRRNLKSFLDKTPSEIRKEYRGL